MSALPASYANALRGDLRTLSELVAEGGDWALAARALAPFGRPEAAARPSLAELEGRDGDGIAEALAHLARAALLEMDHGGLAGCRERFRSLSGPRAALWGRIVDGWASMMAGDGPSSVSAGESAYHDASAASMPTLAVEATTLSAFGRMVTGDIDAATTIARRASRMAQTEHLWLTHYFTSVLLARLRRLGGRPHLAGLIANACLDVTTPVFAGWLLWERLFAGALDEEREAATGAGRAWLLASRLTAGGLPPNAVEELRGLVSASAPHRRDLAVLLAALEPNREMPEGTRWLAGETRDPPPELRGLTPPAWADGAPEAAPVAVGWPGGRAGRRLVGFAVAPPYERLAPVGTRAARPEAVAAALTLAGERGIDIATLFESVYGFRFRKDLHEATFKVERHRAKKLLASVADISSDEGRMALRVVRPYAVPDPRCQKPFSDVLLRQLTEPGGKSARDLAAHLDVPLRTVQQALKELTADGACVASKDGRRVAYSIEDTTFCELTVG